MSLLSFLSKIWDAIRRAFIKLPAEIKQALEIANKVVENIKTFVDSPGVDVLTHLIPGDTDDKIIAILRIVLAKVLAGITFLQGKDFASENDMLKEAVGRIQNSDVDVSKIIRHGVASVLSEKLSNGNLPWSEATAMQENYHRDNKNAA